MRQTSHSRRALRACSLISLLPFGPAMALADEEPLVLDDVMVSAPHREARVSDEPIAINVLDGPGLEEAGVNSIADLEQRVPSLLVSAPNPRYVSYGIRGMGASSYNDGIDASVGTYLDGVYLGRQGMSLGEMLDIERIEVLRGPQGTRYGKNTTAGAVNIISRAPTFAPEGRGEVSVGEDGLRRYRGTVSGALVDEVLAGRLTGYQVERDGLLDNPVNGQQLRGLDRQGWRGQLLWTPNETFSARLTGEYAWQDESDALNASHYSPSSVQRAAYVGYVLPPINPWSGRIYQDQRNSTKVRHNGASLELNQLLDNGATLTSLTAYRDWSYDTQLDGEGSAVDIATVTARLDHHQFSQELRLAGAAGETVDYVVGLYYLRQQLNRQIDARFGADAAAFFVGDQIHKLQLPFPVTADMIPAYLLEDARQSLDGEQRNDSRAIFGQFTWQLTPRLEITPGLRYTLERKQAVIDRKVSELTLRSDPISQLAGGLLHSATLGPNSYRRNSIEERNLSGQLAASYRFTEQLLGYTSWSRGYKAGGINLDVVAAGVPQTFGSERATSLEAGLKSRFWDERAQLDLTLYQTDVDGYQALTTSPPVNEYAPPLRDRMINIDRVRLRGIEVDGLLHADELTDLRLGVALSDARYQDFAHAPCPPGSSQASCNRSGERLFNAPRWSVTAGVAQRYPLVYGLELFSGVDYSFRSGYYGALEGGAGSYQPAYGLTHLRFGLRRADRLWETELWARNVFDTRYLMAAYAQLGSGDYAVMTGEPRSIGITLRSSY